MSEHVSDRILHDDLLGLGLPDLAERALRSEWNDYFGPHTAPQHALLAVVTTDSRLDAEQSAWFRENVLHGKYDGTQAEADAWIKSPEGAEVAAAVFGGFRQA